MPRGRPAKNPPLIVAHLKSVGLASPASIAEAIGAKRPSVNTALVRMREEGIVELHEQAQAYYLARDPDTGKRYGVEVRMVELSEDAGA